MDAEDDDRPARCDELAAPGQARLRPGRLDDDVVDAVGIDPRPEALAGLLLIRVAGLERDRLRAEPAGTGHGEQPERTGADDRDTCARTGAGQPERVPRDGGRLHDGRVTHVEPRREGDQPGRRRTELLGHAPVGADAERSLPVGRAQVVGAARRTADTPCSRRWPRRPPPCRPRARRRARGPGWPGSRIGCSSGRSRRCSSPACRAPHRCRAARRDRRPPLPLPHCVQPSSSSSSPRPGRRPSRLRGPTGCCPWENHRYPQGRVSPGAVDRPVHVSPRRVLTRSCP